MSEHQQIISSCYCNTSSITSDSHNHFNSGEAVAIVSSNSSKSSSISSGGGTPSETQRRPKFQRILLSNFDS